MYRTCSDYYGQSFGGSYGTMLGGTDPLLQAIGLNVHGGPISEVVRLSPSFRPLRSQDLALAQPPLLNGGWLGFTESLPLARQRAVLDPAPGALPIQEFLAEQTWLNRRGARRRSRHRSPLPGHWYRWPSATRRSRTRRRPP